MNRPRPAAPPPRGAAPSPGDVVYDARMHPAVVLTGPPEVTVALTASGDVGRVVPAPDRLRPVQGYGAAERCQWARDVLWLQDGPRPPARPRQVVEDEVSAIRAAPVHTCADPYVCAPGEEGTGCGHTDRHVAALRVEWRAGR